jgi:hypothetical protein
MSILATRAYTPIHSEYSDLEFVVLETSLEELRRFLRLMDEAKELKAERYGELTSLTFRYTTPRWTGQDDDLSAFIDHYSIGFEPIGFDPEASMDTMSALDVKRTELGKMNVTPKRIWLETYEKHGDVAIESSGIYRYSIKEMIARINSSG